MRTTTRSLPRARYSAELDARLQELGKLQALWEAEEPISLRSYNAKRRAQGLDVGVAGEDEEDGSIEERPEPRQPWHNFEKERLRRSLLYFGIGRWETIRGSLKKQSRAKHHIEDVRLTVWDFVRAVRRHVDGREALYLSSRLRNAPDGEGAEPDELVGPWTKVKQLAKVWARRLEVLDKLNRAIDKCIDEETQEDALDMMEAMSDPKLPAWWDRECDFFLLYGVHKHGFGNYDDIRHDPEIMDVFHASVKALGSAAEEQFLASLPAVEGGQVPGGADGEGEAKEGKGYHASTHAPDCRCFVCKFKRRDAAKATAKALGGEDENGNATTEEDAAVKKEDDQKKDEDEGMADGDDQDDDEHDDNDHDADGEDGDDSEDEAETEDEAEKRAEEAQAKETARMKTLERRRERAKLRRRRHNDGAESAHPHAWPSSETLTHRVKRLADKLGAVTALPASDPPWVKALLGRERRRPKRKDLYGGGEEDNEDAQERRARKKARKDKNRRTNADITAAMVRGEWDALGGDGTIEDFEESAGQGLLSRFAEEGERVPGESGMVRGGMVSAGVSSADLEVQQARKKKKPNFTKKDKNELLKAVMSFGLPRSKDKGVDWDGLARLAGVFGKSEADLQNMFQEIAMEMTAVIKDSQGKQRQRDPAKNHKENCSCIVCQIRRRKRAEGAANGDEKDGEGEGPGSDDNNDDDENVEDDGEDAFQMRPAEGGDDDDDEGEGDGDGDEDEDGDGNKTDGGESTVGAGSAQGKAGKRPRRALKKYGLLTPVTAHRLKDRLDMMMTLRLSSDFVHGEFSQLPLAKIYTRELPDWWVPEVHAPGLMAAVLKHGCNAWDAIESDPELPFAGNKLPIPRVCLRVLKILSGFLKRTFLKKCQKEQEAGLRM